MLIVNIEIYPGGNSGKKYSIGRIKIINSLEQHPQTGEYKYTSNYQRLNSNEDYLLHNDEVWHRRENGALELVRKVVNEFVGEIKFRKLPK